MKANFSTNSDQYSKYRPTYPGAFYAYLYQLLVKKQCAWDCGTGTGQVAVEIADIFEEVYATDISQSQLEHATQKANVGYSMQSAEMTNFNDQKFDLIIIGQAIHWFNFEQFYAEVRRTAKEHAIIAAIGYARPQIEPKIDAIITNFYSKTIGQYWDQERKYIDENYQTIPFPFQEIETPSFAYEVSWTFAQLMGYLSTWSAVKHYQQQTGLNPLEPLQEELGTHWQPNQQKLVTFPMLLRLGYINPQPQ